jgi:hypothetical protein
MKIKADIKVMNDVTFTQPVTFTADTTSGALELRTLDKVIELSRKELVEFLDRTTPITKTNG